MRITFFCLTLSLLATSSLSKANANNLALRCTQVGVAGPGGDRYLDINIDRSAASISKIQELHAGRTLTVTANANCDRRNFVNLGVTFECSGTMTPTPEIVHLYGENPYDFSLVLGQNLKGNYTGAFSFDDLSTDSKTDKKFTALWVYECTIKH